MIRLKQLLKEQNLKPYIQSTNWYGRINWNYPAIEKCNNPKDIAAILRKSKGFAQDDEAAAEAAFIAITNRTQAQARQFYDDLVLALGQDAYDYVQTFIDTSVKYHKRSIDNTANIIRNAYNALYSNAADPATPRQVQNTPDVNSFEFIKEMPQIVIGEYGRKQIREYKKRLQAAFNDAVNWWLTYLSLPKTQENFDRNWEQPQVAMANVRPADPLAADIFPKYIAAIKKLKLKVYYSEKEAANAKVWNPEITGRFRREYHINNRYDVNVNVFYTIDLNRSVLKSDIVHEIQHILDHFHPLNPPHLQKRVGLEDDEFVVDAVSKIPNKINVGASQQKYVNILANINSLPGLESVTMYDLQYLIDRTKKKARGDDPEYLCRDSEQTSRLEGMRSNLGKYNLKPADFLPVFKADRSNLIYDYDDAVFLLYCWVAKGFPDFLQYISNLNLLVKNDSDSKKPETIKLKSLVPPQTT